MLRRGYKKQTNINWSFDDALSQLLKTSTLGTFRTEGCTQTIVFCSSSWTPPLWICLIHFWVHFNTIGLLSILQQLSFALHGKFLCWLTLSLLPDNSVGCLPVLVLGNPVNNHSVFTTFIISVFYRPILNFLSNISFWSWKVIAGLSSVFFFMEAILYFGPLHLWLFSLYFVVLINSFETEWPEVVIKVQAHGNFV